METLRKFLRRARSSQGQGTTEYMLVISVLVIAIVAVTYDPMNTAIALGSRDFNTKVKSATETGAFTDDGQAER